MKVFNEKLPFIRDWKVSMAPLLAILFKYVTLKCPSQFFPRKRVFIEKLPFTRDRKVNTAPPLESILNRKVTLECPLQCMSSISLSDYVTIK